MKQYSEKHKAAILLLNSKSDSFKSENSDEGKHVKAMAVNK